MNAFVKALGELKASRNLRAMVLTGAGDKAFVGGADIREMSRLTGPADARTFIERVHACCAAVREMPVPTIARINGFTFGAGLELAASCDVRVAADTALLGMPEVKLGIPSVVEAALLPSLIGWGRARRLLLFGESIRASEALAWGLIERCVSPGALDAAVQEWLDELGTCWPGAVRLQKRLISTWEESGLNSGIAAGVKTFAEAFEAAEPHSAMSRFLDDRNSR